MIVLAITIVLIATLFMYVRHRLMVVESRIELLSDTIQTMAGVTCATLHDSDSETEESSETESECSDLPLEYEDRSPTPERTMVSDDDVKRVNLPETEVEEIEVKKTVPIELEPEIELENVVYAKQVVVNTSLESLTLKELKDKVAEVNGPKLKTKKEILEFLQKI